MPIRMNKETMRARVQEAMEGGDEAAIRQRVQICLDGLRTVRSGHIWANELIEELKLEKFGARFVEPPDESRRARRKAKKD